MNRNIQQTSINARPITKNTCPKYILLVLVLISILTVPSSPHYIKKLTLPPQSLSLYTNQSKPFPLPFKKCFSLTTSLPSNKQLFTFTPSSLSLTPLITYPIHSTHNISLLEELRESLTYKHKGITVLDEDLIMLFSMPNRILIVRETFLKNQDGRHIGQFNLIDQYRIEEIKDMSTQFKMYRFSNNRAIMIVQNHKAFYLLDDKGYQYFQLPIDITLAHLQLLQNQDIIIAEFNKGLGHYRLNHQQKKVEFIKRYHTQELGLEENYIVDVNTNYIQQGQIYLLDAKAGLIKMAYNKESKILSKPQLIIKQSNCQAFDSISNDYFVLLCQVQGYSSIIQVNRRIQNNKTFYDRLQPTYYNTFFSDISVSNKFYMIFSNKLINVFWNTKQNKLPQTLDTQSQITIPGLQTFKLKTSLESKVLKTLLYTVQSGKLVKYLLEQSPPSLTFMSAQPLVKNLTLLISGSCQQLPQHSSISSSNSSLSSILTCQLKQPIMLEVLAEPFVDREDYGVSASIIILLVLIFLVVIWICLKKYKGLEKEARKVLEVYKRKKATNRRAI